MKCNICPRNCGSDRSVGALGFCAVPEEIYVAKIMKHFGEEPCITGKGGAGTVFFSGCNLKCVYCQNRKISKGAYGQKMSAQELEREMLKLVEDGAECLELVTPTHYTPILSEILGRIRSRIGVPIVWNSGGYEKKETLSMLDGLVDVYLPDFKYFSSEISKKYSFAPDYREVATEAIGEMLRQVGKFSFEEGHSDGERMIKRGVIVRHLVLPSHREDSIDALRLLDREFGHENILISLMSQYTPDFYIENECEYGKDDSCRALRRRVTSFEYDAVVKVARELGFEGYFQSRSSADKSYTPDF